LRPEKGRRDGGEETRRSSLKISLERRGRVKIAIYYKGALTEPAEGGGGGPVRSAPRKKRPFLNRPPSEEGEGKQAA